MVPHPRRAAIVAVVAALLVLPLTSMTAQQARQARVYVAVVDAGGQPVTGLTAGDFAIRENDEDKEVLSAGPATQPVALALLTDGLGVLPIFSAPQMREALTTMVRTVRRATSPETQIGLMRVDGSAIQQVKFSNGTATLDNAIGRLVGFPGPSVLLEAIGDTCPTLRRMATDRRVIFALVAGYRGDTSLVGDQEVPECLRQCGASLWALEATFDGGPIGDSRRDFVMRSVTGWSGGMHLAASTGTALDRAASRMADIIVSQYAVVYGPPGRLASGRLEVKVNRPGVRVLAPAWTSR